MVCVRPTGDIGYVVIVPTSSVSISTRTERTSIPKETTPSPVSIRHSGPSDRAEQPIPSICAWARGRPITTSTTRAHRVRGRLTPGVSPTALRRPSRHPYCPYRAGPPATTRRSRQPTHSIAATPSSSRHNQPPDPRTTPTRPSLRQHSPNSSRAHDGGVDPSSHKAIVQDVGNTTTPTAGAPVAAAPSASTHYKVPLQSHVA